MAANTPNNTMHDRAVGAAIRFLERKYWHDIERINCAPFDIVARDGETVVFVNVGAASKGEFPPEPTRADYDRALLRHHVNAARFDR